ncbi:MAG: histidine--tRNA ligase [Defluviitaleaceae bacterium]|nr:histidine--tRNA ligase [Defluviitaleaceae bacterium]
MAINTKPMSGTMELLPHEQAEFERIKSLIEGTYKSFGFVSLDTPVIERAEVLFKEGAEINKQIYYTYNGLASEKIDALALRFDLTVPLARYVSEHFSSLTFPFRRLHIGKVYRGERAQKGRYREFYQCDIDVIGRGSLDIHYDAELPVIIYEIFKKMDIGKFTVKVNNRKVLNGFYRELGAESIAADVLRVVDKADKITHEEFLKALEEIGLNTEQVTKLLAFVGIKGSVAEVLAGLNALGIQNELFCEGVSELKTVTDIMTEMGMDADYFAIDLSIARGLDYYTGTVYETTLDDTPIGSICGGGRYDNLAENYSKEKLPGVGISIGLTRLFYLLREEGLINPTNKSASDVIVLPETKGNIPQAIEAAAALREARLNVDIMFEDVKMNKKLQYITKKDAPYTVVARTNPEGENYLSLQYKVDDEIIKEAMPLEYIVTKISNAISY